MRRVIRDYESWLIFSWKLRSRPWVKSAEPTRGRTTMGKQFIVIVSAVFVFWFGSALRSNAGTDMIEPYRAPAPTYNYAPPPPPPPPRPILYVPPPVVGVVVAPAFGYYGRGYGFYGGHRYFGGHAHGRGHHKHWH
jgi:hypothetical protein